MYTPSDLSKALEHPTLMIAEFNRLVRKINRVTEYNQSGEDYLEKDWDNMIILDACRYDYFVDEVQSAEIEGEIGKTVSLASTTSEWIQSNFADKKLNDLVYVTSNGQYTTIRDEIDCTVFKYRDVTPESPDPQKVKPKYVTAAAIEEHENHPDKRLLVHYTPPHHPYLGKKYGGFGSENRDIHDVITDNDVTPERLRNAYAENVQIALSEASKLVEKITGKTIITADHGELLGDRIGPIPCRFWGHTPGIYHEKLVTVPWFVPPFETRREITAESPVGDVNVVNEEVVEKRLEYLGYVEN